MTTIATGSGRRAWEVAARAGYAASGLVHVLIGLLAVQLAAGGGSGSTDQTGAFSQIASTPFGAVTLWVSVVAFVALAAWQAAAAISGAAGETGDRAKAGAKAAVYLALAVTAFGVLQGAGSSDGTSSFTGRLMQAPGGRVLVGAVGLGVLAVAVHHVRKGWRRTFLDDLRRLPAGPAGRWAERAGVVGYVAKGAALGVVGVLFVLAASHADPGEAGGLDAALQTLRDAPAGPLLLGLVAVGLVAFGLYCGVRARFARM